MQLLWSLPRDGLSLWLVPSMEKLIEFRGRSYQQAAVDHAAEGYHRCESCRCQCGRLLRQMQALPAELSLLVLSHLDLSEILKCASVSHRWAELCNNQGPQLLMSTVRG